MAQRGLLAGRELAIIYQLARNEAGSFRSVITVVLKDLGKIFLGLIVSLILALAITDNPVKKYIIDLFV